MTGGARQPDVNISNIKIKYQNCHEKVIKEKVKSQKGKNDLFGKSKERIRKVR